MTLAHAGCRTVAMVTDKPTHTSYAAFDLAARVRYRFPLLTRTSVTDILGSDRVTAVEVTDHATGERSVIECDTVVFTGDWIAENELPRRLGVAMNTSATGPAVDGSYRTSEPGVFAVGNLLHPASTADRCALDGRAAAAAVAAWAGDGPPAWRSRGVEITVDGAGAVGRALRRHARRRRQPPPPAGGPSAHPATRHGDPVRSAALGGPAAVGGADAPCPAAGSLALAGRSRRPRGARHDHLKTASGAPRLRA